MTRATIAAASAALLLAAPAVAVAKKPEDKGSKGKGSKTVSFVLKGTYEGGSTVLVAKGNGPAKKAGLVGETVTLDLSRAKIVADDVNADGVRNVDDVQVGDKVVYSKYGGTEVKYDNEEYLILYARDVLAVVQK